MNTRPFSYDPYADEFDSVLPVNPHGLGFAAQERRAPKYLVTGVAAASRSWLLCGQLLDTPNDHN